MSTEVRAPGGRAGGPGGLPPSLRQSKPVSTVTTVSKLVHLLATTFSGDLMDSLTDFQRRVTLWEHEAKDTLPDLINI